MTEPLIVDTDQLDSASKILGQAAGAIPAPLPKLSVPGTDPLSLAVATGAVQVEAPMAALSAIEADATTTAENIGVAGQKYSAVDQAYAEKAKQLQQQFGTDGSKPPQIGVDRNPLTNAAAVGKGSKDDFQKAALTAAEETATRTADAVGKKTLETLGDAGRKANKGLVTAFQEGKVVPGSSLVGGGLKGIFAGVDILTNRADGDSWSKAIGKTAVSTAAGTYTSYAMALVGQAAIPIPGVGAAIGFTVGYGASYLVEEFVDENWEAWADGVGSVKNAVASVFGFG